MEKVVLIINPASGQDYPILSVANRVFAENRVKWEPLITMEEGDAFEFAEYGHKQKADAVLVYGGDGTIMEAAEALYKTNTPIGIIPGGTANVLAKEVGIPQDAEAALRLFSSKEVSTKAVDMGKVTIYDEDKTTTKRFILRLSVGMMADMVVNTSRERKNTFGNLAYTVSALQQMPAAEIIKYKVIIDGKELELEGATLMITNAGNIGVSGVQFDPHVSITDGRLDMILIKGADIPAMMQLLAGAVLQTSMPAIDHWHGEKVTVEIDKSRFLVCDDVAYKMQKAEIEINPQSIQLLVPPQV
jgi:diacylglycerol kinase (ATP)